MAVRIKFFFLTFSRTYQVFSETLADEIQFSMMVMEKLRQVVLFSNSKIINGMGEQISHSFHHIYVNKILTIQRYQQ